MKNHCAKMRLSKRCFRRVHPEQRKVVDWRKCTPPLSIRAMLCIELMVKDTCQQQNSMWCPFAANVFSEFLLFLFRDMLLIFLLIFFFQAWTQFCFFFIPVVFFFSFGIFFTDHIWPDICVFLLSISLILCISAFPDTVKSNSKSSKESNSKERAGLKTYNVTIE